MNLSIEQKEKELNGKRYKIISIAIQKRKDMGEDIPFEMEIDLHHCWMLTMKKLRNEEEK